MDRFDQLLADARQGRDAAWAEIYKAYAPRILFFHTACGASNPEQALRRTFTRAARELPGFQGDEDEFRHWLFSHAANVLADLVDPDKAHRPVRAQGTMATALQVPFEARAVLLLRLQGGLTVEEVADAIGASPAAVRQLQRQGLEALEALHGEPA